jgi:hypothetical protein
MADILSALSGNLGDQDYYQSQDPFYMSGRGMAQMQLPQATSNAQAIFGPALQGLLSGTLMGYGKQQATQQAYDAYRDNPFVRALAASKPENASGFVGPLSPDQLKGSYSSELAPEGWDAKQGKSDLMLGALAYEKAQKQQEAKEQIKLEIAKKLAGEGLLLGEDSEVSSLPGFADAKANIVGAETAARKRAEIEAEGGRTSTIPGLEGIPKQLESEAIKEKGTLASKKQALQFIEDKFKDAEKLVGLKAGLSSVGVPFTDISVPSKEGEALIGLADSVITQIDKAVGREINSDVRKRMLNLAPKWNDSKKTVQDKSKELQKLVASLYDTTPTLDTYKPSTAKYTESDLAAAGYSAAEIADQKAKGNVK